MASAILFSSRGDATSPALLASIAEEEEPKKAKKKRPKSKSAKRPEAVTRLREQVRKELERMLELAHDDETLLESELSRLALVNAELSRRKPAVAHVAEVEEPSQPERQRSHQRWITPKQSGYESDSTTADDDSVLPSLLPTEVVTGKAQERVLRATRLALSRAAMCEVFTDPGATDRREALLRALTTLANAAKQ